MQANRLHAELIAQEKECVMVLPAKWNKAKKIEQTRRRIPTHLPQGKNLRTGAGAESPADYSGKKQILSGNF
jgi:hypothetical protein